MNETKTSNWRKKLEEIKNTGLTITYKIPSDPATKRPNTEEITGDENVNNLRRARCKGLFGAPSCTHINEGT